MFFSEKLPQKGATMSDEHSGACLCGGVSFKTHGKLREVVACHCSQCRKQTGLYYAATNVAIGDLVIETCGSALFWAADGAEEISIMAGLFNQPTGFEIAYHIYCADKGDYYEITDGLPQYRQGRPGLLTAGPSD